MQYSNSPGAGGTRRAARLKTAVVTGMTLSFVLAAVGCSGSDSQRSQLTDAGDKVTVTGPNGATQGGLSVAASSALFASAPAVVVASAGHAKGVKQGADDAASLGVPMLLLDEDAKTQDADDSPVAKEIDRLEADTVLATDSRAESDLGDLSGVEIVTSADDVPEATPEEERSDLAVLVRSDEGAAARAAATASAEAAGAAIVPVAGADLRSDPAAISTLAEADPDRVLAIGSQFGPAKTLSGRVELARTGVELPGGGQALFPHRRLVALYGTPGTADLGVLGEQDLAASIKRAKDLAAEYKDLGEATPVPTFEIIATIAHDSPGDDGDYSGEIDVADLRPWVEKAGEEGVYVVLDLQPGRANFLDQAKLYEELLRMPHVGLALDPEWRLTPTQKPLGQIGSVEAEEVNSVVTWLADLTREEKLPQKLLVLHQFRLSMLQDQDQIDHSRDEVEVLVHMDGQGTQDLKDATWRAVKGAAAKGTPFGWKNFLVEDQPVLTPEQTMAKKPTPSMISYQ